MTLFYPERGGIGLDPCYFLEHDRTIRDRAAPFAERTGVNPDSLFATFFGDSYSYLREAVSNGMQLYVVTHPETTYTCWDKVDMYNRYGCGLDLSAGSGHAWALEDTVKAIYFRDNASERIIVTVIPGKETRTHIELESFRHPVRNPKSGLNPYSDNAVNEEATNNTRQTTYFTKSGRKKRIRPYPVGAKPLFGVGVEGSLSPFPPEDYREGGNLINTTGAIAAIYMDERLLERRGRFVDLSISSRVIEFPEPNYLQQRIGEEYARNLWQVRGGEAVPLDIVHEPGGRAAHVDGPIIRGDYRELTTTPHGDSVTLMHHVLPNHRLSVLIDPYDLRSALERTFSHHTYVTPFEYEQPS